MEGPERGDCRRAASQPEPGPAGGGAEGRPASVGGAKRDKRDRLHGGQRGHVLARDCVPAAAAPLRVRAPGRGLLFHRARAAVRGRARRARQAGRDGSRGRGNHQGGRRRAQQELPHQGRGDRAGLVRGGPHARQRFTPRGRCDPSLRRAGIQEDGRALLARLLEGGRCEWDLEHTGAAVQGELQLLAVRFVVSRRAHD